MMNVKFVMTCIFFLLLSSCSTWLPLYKKPIIKMPKHWRVQSERTKKSQKKINTLAWWKSFHDPQLNHLIAEALANNNDLGIAAGHLLQARASLQKVQASWLPVGGIGGTGFTSRVANFDLQAQSGSPLPGFSQSNMTPFSGYLAGFLPTYTLNIMLQYELTKVGYLNITLQESVINAIRLGIISQVAGSYFSLLGLQQQLDLQIKLVRDIKLMRRYATIQFENGAISREHIAALDQLLDIHRRRLPILRHDMTRFENALNVLINKNPTPILLHNRFDNLDLKGKIPINLPAEILKNRPDVAIAEYQYQISHIMIWAAAAQFFPTLNLTGFLGSTSIEVIKFIHLTSGFAIGQLTGGMPIFDMGIYADIAKAKGGKYAAFYDYIKSVRNALADVENSLSQQKAVDRVYAHQLAALQQAKEQYEIIYKQYQQGTVSYAETVMYKMNVDYMEIVLSECKVRQVLSMVSLYQALGGGYCAKAKTLSSQKWKKFI